MGLTMTGEARLTSPQRCNWCGCKTTHLIKIHSKEDKSTLRICESHYKDMPTNPRQWDMWVTIAFPKYGAKIFHREGYEAFKEQALSFMRTLQPNKEFRDNAKKKRKTKKQPKVH